MPEGYTHVRTAQKAAGKPTAIVVSEGYFYRAFRCVQHRNKATQIN